MTYENLGVRAQRPHFTFDALFELKDAGLVAASAACQVDAAAKVVDLGGAGLFKGIAVINISAIEIASNDEVYTIHIQGSSSATFASAYVSLAMLQFGANEVLAGDQDTVVGKFLLPFFNWHNGALWRYIRGYTVVAGSIASGGGINYDMYVAKGWDAI